MNFDEQFIRNSSEIRSSSRRYPFSQDSDVLRAVGLVSADHSFEIKDKLRSNVFMKKRGGSPHCRRDPSRGSAPHTVCEKEKREKLQKMRRLAAFIRLPAP